MSSFGARGIKVLRQHGGPGTISVYGGIAAAGSAAAPWRMCSSDPCAQPRPAANQPGFPQSRPAPISGNRVKNGVADPETFIPAHWDFVDAAHNHPVSDIIVRNRLVRTP